MKKIMKIAFIFLGILSIIGIVLSIKSYFFKQKFISIIGEADGPTSIFIAGKAGNNHLLLAVAAIVLTGAVILLLLKHKHKKDS